MNWTRQQRYLPYEKHTALELLKLQAQADRSTYQLHYHIRPSSGLLNDPNGFSYFNNQWHVFYQSFPFGAVHGLKSWMHMVSDDLVHWRPEGLAIRPSNQYDSHGAYSGSAKVIGKRLFLMYTGNHRDQDWQRTPYQLGAWMRSNGSVTKLSHPLFTKPDNISEHFRDPQLLKDNGKYYALLGAQTAADKAGHIDVWSSDHLETGWHELGLAQISSHQMGYMIECPNLVDVDGQAVIIFCPQGLDKDVSSYQNIYPNMYLTGSHFNWDRQVLENSSEIPVNFDDGFDVYATQAFNAPDGKAYAISWVGLPDTTYPSDQENWANCLSQVKELHMKDGKLIQQPVKQMTTLRDESNYYSFKGQVPLIREHAGQQYELQLSIEKDQQGILQLAASDDRQNSLDLKFDTGQGSLIIDRGHAGQSVATDHGNTRSISIPEHQDLALRIFVDHSLAEIFVNNGEHVATLRYFAPQTSDAIAFNEPIKSHGEYWPLFNM